MSTGQHILCRALIVSLEAVKLKLNRRATSVLRAVRQARARVVVVARASPKTT